METESIHNVDTTHLEDHLESMEMPADQLNRIAGELARRAGGDSFEYAREYAAYLTQATNNTYIVAWNDCPEVFGPGTFHIVRVASAV